MGMRGTVVVALSLAAGLSAQSVSNSSDAERATESLRKITRELNDTTRRLQSDLGRIIDRDDRRFRLRDRTPIAGADADLVSGPADLMWAAKQKFTVFRMLTARDAKGEPATAADLEHIQQSVVDARKRVDAATAVLRRMLVVSAANLDRTKEAAEKLRRDQLWRSRAEAEDAAKQALMLLPLDQEQASAQDDTAQKVWDSLASAKTRQAAIPVRFARRQRVTVIDEASYRFAITDSGIEDGAGRHVFYQEEWVQRGPSVIRLRWRVGMDPGSGRHILLKRYSPVELRGELANLYEQRDRYYLWYLEPEDDSAEPTRDEIESALAGLTHAREALRAAATGYLNGVRDALSRQDRDSGSPKQPRVDYGLPDELRVKLFAIRAHIARVPEILGLEEAVRGAVSAAEAAIRDMEPLAALANRGALDRAFVLDRSDLAVDSVRSAEAEALRFLPPDSTRSEDTFPAMGRNMIVRIRQAPTRTPQGNAVKCVQEIWQLNGGALGDREVRRVVSLILIDPRTGNQTHAGTATRYYKAAPEDVLEEIYDEYAADDVVKGG